MLNVEIKARCSPLDRVRRVLKEEDARFVGEDDQTDTYFRVRRGRLKLREGTIEEALIHYDRPDEQGPKPSDVLLYTPQPASELKALLKRALGVLVVVEKRREIYFLGNVKVHLDRVKELGTFVEIEAQDADGTLGAEELRAQCEHYMARFGLSSEALVAHSYSDMMVQHQTTDASA